MPLVPSPHDSSIPVYEIETINPENPDETITSHLTVIDVTAKYLASLKMTAENFSGEKIKGCVLSIPFHFEDQQQRALIEAAKLAGFSTVYEIHEAAAAALAFHSVTHGLGPIVNTSNATGKENANLDKLLLVLDLGGSQYKVTLISANAGTFTILSSAEDTQLGGSAFDKVLADSFAKEFKRKTKFDIEENRRSKSKLLSASEVTKRLLSRNETSPCHVESLHEGLDFSTSINRGKFEMLIDHLLNQCLRVTQQAMEEGDIFSHQIDEVLLVGGCARMPRFQTKIKTLFPPSTLFRTDIEPDQAISHGCANQAFLVTTCNFDLETIASKPEFTVVPHLVKSIGIAGASNEMIVLFPRHLQLPARRTLLFSNVSSDQTEMYMAIYEGEDLGNVRNNSLLAEVVIGDLVTEESIGKRSIIEVTFEIESDKVLNVIAKTKGEKKGMKVKICPKSHH